ncbi:MAG: 13E12 repeat family protein, partial [Actinomycetota bacterium]|nr:13E12 repeat family protein [Actinomycetota bacterium]
MTDPCAGWPRDPEDLIAVIEECEREVARLQARQLAAIARLDAVRAGTPLEGFTDTEVGLALTLSPNAARSRLHVATTLAGPRAATMRLLADGQIDYYRAVCVVTALDRVEDPVADAVEAKVLPTAAGRTATQLKTALRRAIATVDPAGMTKRHVAAAAQRDVTLSPAEDGMAWVNLYAPADAAMAVYSAADGLARTARREPGETRTLAQLRVDLLAGIAA